MSEAFRKYGFSAGVVSETLLGRTDLEKYELALRSALNFVVDPLGGLRSRPAFEFVDYLQQYDKEAITWNFRFNSNLENNYTILFEEQTIRFVQNGAYVLEDPLTISDIVSGTFTVIGHGYSVGDMVKIDGGTYLVKTETTNTFTLTDVFDVAVTFSTSSPSTVQRVYTLSSPYLAADLKSLVFDQVLDELVITHADYKRRKLVRSNTTSWALTEISESVASTGVTNLVAAASASGTAGVVYAVAVINDQGQEELLTADSYILIDNIVNFTATAGQVELTWDAVAGARGYRIYRSYVASDGGELTFAADLGFLGESASPQFLDINIIPDFSQSPLEPSILFVDGGIAGIDITASGTGYDRNTTTVTMSGGGTGFEGAAIVNGSGAIIGVLILNPGSGYTAPTVSFGGAGSGATATATASSSAGNNPASVTVSQQRRVFAGTSNAPSSIFGSRIGVYDSFASSGFARADDPYNYTLDQQEFTPIRFMTKSRDGIFLYASNEITLLRGIDDAAIVPGAARAIPQAEHGIAQLYPLRIENEFLYLTSAGSAVRSLRPSNLPTYYTTVSLSRLVAEFVKADNPIVSWAWTKDPTRLVWAARQDGTGLALTFDPEVQVWAWTEIATAGYFENFSASEENGIDIAYAITRRTINGREVRYLERSKPNEPETPDDVWASDAALQSTLIYPNATLTLSAYTGTVTATASAVVFSAGDVGKHFRAGTGFGRIKTFIDSTTVQIELWRDINQFNPMFSTPPAFPIGAWSMTAPQTVFSGLDHLEGRTVDIQADGSIVPQQVVTNGQITLQIAASLVRVGLPFDGYFSTLPPEYQGAGLDNRRMAFQHLYLRFYKSGAMEVGDGELFYDVSDTGDSPAYDVPPPLRTSIERVGVSASFDFDGQLFFRKVGPVHVHLLGYMGDLDFETD